MYFKIIALFFLISSCSSYKEFQYITEEFEIPSKIFNSAQTQAWAATLKVLQKLDLAEQNQETGVIKTRWIDNTYQLNFADSFGGRDLVKSAKYKLVVNVIKGFRGSREVSKVTVYKRQMLERDFLQGWKVVRSDGIFEKTILYRIERTILIEKKLGEIESKINKKTEEKF